MGSRARASFKDFGRNVGRLILTHAARSASEYGRDAGLSDWRVSLKWARAMILAARQEPGGRFGHAGDERIAGSILRAMGVKFR